MGGDECFVTWSNKKRYAAVFIIAGKLLYIVADLGLCCQVNILPIVLLILLCILGSKDICEQNQDELEALIQSSDEEEIDEIEDKQKGNGEKEKPTRKRTKKV